MHDLLVDNAINYSLLGAPDRKAYLVSNKYVDLTFETDTKSDKTAMSAFIRNGYLEKKSMSTQVF